MQRLPLVLLLALVWSAAAPAQDIRTDTLRIAVADGVDLMTIVHLPDGDGPHPVVLLRNPYRTRGGAKGWLVERLVPHGYAVVEQDVRGTGGSDGRFMPFVFDVHDGTLTLDWLAAQPWAGPVGLWGISYQGWAAYALAETGHPAVEAVAVGSAWADMEPFFAPGGAFNLMAHLTWLRGFAGGAGFPSQAELDGLFRTLPLGQLFGPMQAIADAAQPFRFEALDVPALHFTGWNDYVYPHSLEAFGALRARRGADGSQQLIIGPWAHNDVMSGVTRAGDVDYGPRAAAGVDAVVDWTRLFFDVHLRGLPDDEAPVRVFVMGENDWRTFDDWPAPEASSVGWYLGPAGTLASVATGDAGATAFLYDPNDPMPTLGGANSHFFPRLLGPLDQRPLDGRSDVVSFLTPPLEQSLTLAGPIRAVLHVEADAPATDVVAKLIMVAPDGTARLVEDGIRRVMDLAPGVNEVMIEMGQTAIRLDAGTRLRLDVTGGNFPKYDRNPNTGEDAWAASELRPVNITVHHGGAHASRVEVMMLPE
jgi:uncharacterized protein